MHNLLIADDHKMFLDGLLYLLEDIPKYNVLNTANDGTGILEFLEKNNSQPIDLVISDLAMPGLGGLPLSRALKKKYPGLKILIISMHHDPAIVKDLLKNKIDGYVPKDAGMEELLAAIDTVMAGQQYYSPKTQAMVFDSFFMKPTSTQRIKLTHREEDILRLIAKEHTSQEIADLLFISKHTVESYRKSLIVKLGVRNLAGLTKQAINLGLVE